MKEGFANYVIESEGGKSVDKDSIRKALEIQKNELSYVSKDKNYIEICKRIEKLKSDFMSCIGSLSTKINETFDAPSETVKKLPYYVNQYQKIKNDTKEKIKEFETKISEFSKEFDKINPEYKQIITKSENISDEDKKIIERRNEIKKNYYEIKKQLPIIKQTLERTKYINTEIKTISINRFGIATIKTINNCINNFILKFNEIIQKLNVVILKKESHSMDKIKKFFSQNRFRLKDINLQINDSETKDGLMYWYNRLYKIVNNKSYLNMINDDEFFLSYDNFLDNKIKILKKDHHALIDKLFKICEQKNIRSVGTNDLEEYSKLVQKFRKDLLDYLYTKENIEKISKTNLESLFTVGLIRATVDIYNENYGIIKLKSHTLTESVASIFFGGLCGSFIFTFVSLVFLMLLMFFALLFKELIILVLILRVVLLRVMGIIGALYGAIGVGIANSQDLKARTPQGFSLNRDDKKYIKKIKSK